MGMIPQDLVTFKSEVQESLGSMNSKMEEMINKIDQVTRATEVAQDGFNSNYNSANKASILTSFSSITKTFNEIKTDLNTNLSKMLSKSKEIIDKVTKLEEINAEIEEQKSIINTENSKKEPSQSIISNAWTIINAKNNEFEQEKNDAEQMLKDLKEMDSSFKIKLEESNSTELPTVTSGTFQKNTFTASNGVKVSYYIYTPNVESTKGLPINMYIHGSGEVGGGVLNQGLAKQINTKEVVPQGIIICPQITEQRDYYNPHYQRALVELTHEVVKTYQADPDRISLSGHSAGAIMNYNLVKAYPGYFSAMVPISGGEYLDGADLSSFKDIKVWAFHGDRDSHTERAGYNNVVNRTIAPLKNAGFDAELTTLTGKGHGIQNSIFNATYQNSDGEIINPLVWAFQQSKKNN